MGTRGYVDVDTGELIRLFPYQGAKYMIPGGYVIMGLVNNTRLVRANLPKNGYRLALSMASRAVAVTGLVYCTNQEYAEELGIRAAEVSRLIGKLAKCGFIYRMNPRVVMVNPTWAFRGTPAEQHAAIEAWAKLHPLGLVHRNRPLVRAS